MVLVAMHPWNIFVGEAPVFVPLVAVVLVSKVNARISSGCSIC